MGGNQSLQVGAEALSGALAGVLAAISIRLPLPALGAFALLAAVLLVLRPVRRPDASLPFRKYTGPDHGQPRSNLPYQRPFVA